MISALYRTNVAFTQAYQIIISGEPTQVYTPVVWYKGNVQPYKQGITGSLTDAGTVFKDWRSLYTKVFPEADTSQIPPDAQIGELYVYFDGSWYSAQAVQNWSIQARGVQHFKYLLVRAAAGAQPPFTPVPFAGLVSQFEAATRELEQTAPLVEQVTQ